MDYAVRLKRVFGPGNLWDAGLSNDVGAYISSRRVPQGGGYEAGFAMIYCGHPAAFAPTIEETDVQHAQ